MKKLIYRLYVVSLLLALITVSCTKDFDEINSDPNKPTKVPTAYLLTSFQEFAVDNLYDEWFGGRFSYLYAQYWSQLSYTDESRYHNRENTINSWWTYCYAGRDIDPPDGELNGGGIIDLIEMIRLNTDEASRDAAAASGANENQIAVARILKAWNMQIVTDVWGDVPYTEALEGAANPLPAYTSQRDIYGDLLNELNEAQQQIDVNAAGVNGDLLYGGDMALWKKFANSLRLRVAIRMSKVPAGNLPSGVSSISAVIADAVADGVFESNADNAVLHFLGSVPNNHPLNENAKTRSDFAISEPFVALLNSYGDPRVNSYADLPADPSVTVVTGFPYGLTQSGATALDDNFYSRVDGTGPDPTGASFDGIYAADAPAVFMDYAEVCFILSEANGYDQTQYENGIRASCEYWGIDEADITAYLASVPAASAQTVAEQKYIALYVQNCQGWIEWRRTGYPVLGLTQVGIMEPGLTEIPRRMYYPFDEETNNTANWKAACQAQGWGDTDLLDDRVWWDVE